jgi:hypothetical protein
LRRFVDVEDLCMPVLERYHVHPGSVWLRELALAHDAIVTAIADFAESMVCEHDDCPYFNVLT